MWVPAWPKLESRFRFLDGVLYQSCPVHHVCSILRMESDGRLEYVYLVVDIPVLVDIQASSNGAH